MARKSSSKTVGRSTAQDTSSRILILLHGIRTTAAWSEKIADTLRDIPNLRIQPIKYGYFDIFRFWFPFWTRKAPVDRFVFEFRDIRRSNPGAKISILAHSFGTYVVARAIRENPDIVVDQLAFCGSVVKERFHFSTVRSQIESYPVLNDCGSKDIWPVIAKLSTWGYGATGTFGFGSNGVRDRYHNISHSEFFSREFAKANWLTFFKDRKIEPTQWEVNRPPPPYWFSLLNFIPINNVILAAVILYLIFPLIDPFAVSKMAIADNLSVGHWLGAPRVQLLMDYSNPHLRWWKFFVKKAVLVGGKQQQFVLYPSSVNCGQQLTSTEVFVAPYQPLRCKLEFYSDRIAASAFTAGDQNYLLARQSYSNQQPDPTRTIFSQDETQKLQNFASSNFVWHKGVWKLEMTYVDQGKDSIARETDLNAAFMLDDDDVKDLRAIMDHYRTGIGVIQNWMDYGTDQLIDTPVIEIGNE